MIKIALIIPYFNAEPWLERCLRSIGSQPFTVILVNDQSKDDGPMIATEACMSSEDWHHFETYDKTGAAHARNVGLEAAIAKKSDYVAFLDADDELTPDAWDNMTHAIEAEPDAPVIQFNHYMVEKNGWKTPRMYNDPGTYELGNLPKLWVSSVNKVFKADLVNRIRFDNKLNHGEDELFVLNCLAKARRIYHSKLFTMVYHRDNPHSLSKSTTLDDLLDEQRALFAFLVNHSDDVELRNAVRIRQAELWNNAVYKRVFGGAS